jgi:hypothetical protein
MALEEEKLLPRELRDKQLKSPVNIRGWKYGDIPRVIKACRELGLAIYGGHPVFCLPDAARELYWKKANPHTKLTGETWERYVDRSCSEFLVLVKELFDHTDFEGEATRAFDLFRGKKQTGILDYLCFKIDIVSESRYAIYFK